MILFFRSIRCARILIHMNLFASFAINNFLWMLWYYLMFTTERLLDQVNICIIMNDICVMLFVFRKHILSPLPIIKIKNAYIKIRIKYGNTAKLRSVLNVSDSECG